MSKIKGEDYPWCPAGCEQDIDKFLGMLMKQENIVRAGEHLVICPVCEKPIKIFTRYVIVYECEKAKGWNE